MAVVTNITEAEFAEFAAPLSGLPVSAVWLSDYTVLYLELGEVIDAYDSGRPRAQFCVYFGLDWEFGAEHSPILSSSEPDAKARIEDLLVGQSIAGIFPTKQLELQLRFESNARMRSTDRDADPEWTIFLPSGSCLGVRAGSLVVETSPSPVA